MYIRFRVYKLDSTLQNSLGQRKTNDKTGKCEVQITTVIAKCPLQKKSLPKTNAASQEIKQNKNWIIFKVNTLSMDVFFFFFFSQKPPWYVRIGKQNEGKQTDPARQTQEEDNSTRGVAITVSIQ